MMKLGWKGAALLAVFMLVSWLLGAWVGLEYGARLRPVAALGRQVQSWNSIT